MTVFIKSRSVFLQRLDCQLLRQKSRQKFSVMETKKLVFPEKIVCFGDFNSRFVLKTTEIPVFMPSLLRFFWLTFDVLIDDPYLT